MKVNVEEATGLQRYVVDEMCDKTRNYIISQSKTKSVTQSKKRPNKSWALINLVARSRLEFPEIHGLTNFFLLISSPSYATF